MVAFQRDPTTLSDPLYWRFSGFYFCYFAALGALLPYWGPYLKSLSLDAMQIGTLMAVMMATKIVAPNVWGWVADRVGRPMAIARFASMIAAVTFSGVLFARDFGSLVAIICCFSFFWNASLPQVEATTLAHLGPASNRYSRIRLWGSVGFVVIVVGLGPVIDAVGVGVIPAVVIVLFAGIWLSSLFVPERRAPLALKGGHDSLIFILRRPEAVALLAVCFLMQAGHGPYYAFFSIYLEEHGYKGATIGALWAVGVVAEVAVFFVMHRCLRRFGARRLLLFSLAVAMVRWLLIGVFADTLSVLLLAQSLHAATFGVYHAAAIHLIHNYFRGRSQVRGQALYSSLSFGAGGALGSYCSGFLWSSAAPLFTYSMAASVSGVGLLIAWLWVRDVPAEGAFAGVTAANGFGSR